MGYVYVAYRMYVRKEEEVVRLLDDQRCLLEMKVQL